MKPYLLCVGLVSLMLLSSLPITVEGEESSLPDVVISEILVSASGEDYNGTDWNNDGYTGSSSDQFIELWNRGNEVVNISNWWLDDDLAAGSAQCSIGWGTSLQPDERIVFFRADTGIELDYFDADSANLLMPDGTLVDTLAYPGEDSWWDNSYIPDGDGIIKITPPTPGWIGENAVDARDGRCYTPRDHIQQGSYILTGRVVTMEDYTSVLPNGSIKVTDGEIEAVWNTGEVPPLGVTTEGTPVYHTGATIYPGLIDMHQHLTYNVAPLWALETHISTSSQNEWGGYQNRYQWTKHQDYGSEVSKVKIAIQSQPYWNMESQAMKYVEMKEIVGGTTAIQGDGHNYAADSYDDILTRNIEHYNWGRDEVETKILQLDTDYSGNHIKRGNESGELDAWFLHLAEGVDQSSLDEFDIIENNDLLVGELIIIHGTALTSVEFEKMAAVGASLVWSPTSNLLLYGDTTDVKAAKEAGLVISLAPDWSPSGTKSPLHELKTADLWNKQILDNTFNDYELVQMVTSNPAYQMKWQDKVGKIKPGLAADFAIIDSFDEDPYRNLIDAVDPDVRLTIVGGLAQFGDLDLMQAMKGDDLEVVQIDGEFDKALDVTYLGIEDGSQTWDKIVEDLEMALRFDREEMYDYFGSSFDNRSDFDDMWTTGSYKVMHSIPLDGIFTWGDDRYFSVLNNSFTANHQISFSQIYDDYYSVAMDANGNRAINFDWQPGTEFDGKPPASEILVEMTIDWTDNNGIEKSSEIHLELYPDKAPIHVDNFVSHIENETYDGTIFHRIIDDFMMQGGDFTEFSGAGGHAANWYGYCKGEVNTKERCAKQDWTIPDETDNGLTHQPFVISMAKTSNPNSGGSQFFITESSSPHLDGIHTVFGKVVSGRELITAIQSVETNSADRPLKDVTLTEIKIVDSFTTDEVGEPVVSDPGKDDSIVEGGTCNAGETKPPDNADCRYCVCQGDSTWKCDSGACTEEKEQTVTDSAKSGGLSTSSLAIGAAAVVIFIATIALTANSSTKNKDNPWDKELEDIVIEQVPEMPPLEGGPPKA